MTRFHKKKLGNMLLNALKIGFGSSLAIFIASMLDLEYAITAGSIALLTIVTTNGERLNYRLSESLHFLLQQQSAELYFSMYQVNG